MQTEVVPDQRNRPGESKLPADNLNSADWDLLYHISLDMNAGMERQRLLDKLEQSVRLYVKAIVAKNLGGILEFEDIIQDIQSRLTRVWTNRGQIKSMKGYVQAVSLTCCAEYLRDKCPNHYICCQRLEYRLDRRDEFALWKVGREKFGGLSQWQMPDSAMLTANPKLERLLKSPYQMMSKIPALQDIDIRAVRCADVVLAALFVYVGQPVSMKHLVTIFQDIWDLQDHENEEFRETGPQQPSKEDDPLTQLIARHDREFNSQCLWKQVKALPRKHRCVILLHARQRNPDMSLIKGLIIHEITNRAEITQVLEFQPGDLTVRAMSLPMSTRAEMLGLPMAEVMTFTPEELEAEILKLATEELELNGMRLPLDYKAIAPLLGCQPGHVARLRGQAMDLLEKNRCANSESGQD